MSNNKYVDELKITSISYIHDPAAMDRWVNLYVELLKEKFEQNFEENRTSSHNM